MQKLQNRAARIISSMSNDVDHSVALHVLGWEPLDTTRKKAKARMIYKTLSNIGPESLTKLFHCKNETTKYNLRNISGSLCLPQPRTNSMKNSFMYDGAKLWNSIPKEIRESKINPYRAFKIELLLTHSKVKPLVHSAIYNHVSFSTNALPIAQSGREYYPDHPLPNPAAF